MTARSLLYKIGTVIEVYVTDHECVDQATAVVGAVVEDFDIAVSRFRDDSELAAINAAPGVWHQLSPVAAICVDAALRAAQLTDGLVDPSVGADLMALGYDVTFSEIANDGPVNVVVSPRPRFAAIEWDRNSRRIRIPEGMILDLGATAKALLADVAAERAATHVGCGVLVNCGGDVAFAGSIPDQGWEIRIAVDYDDEDCDGAASVRLLDGGMATSGPGARTWRRGGTEVHHLIDPRTGLSAPVYWDLVTVVAATCVDANIASTAAALLGAPAEAWIAERGLSARLVRHGSGVVSSVGLWPTVATA